MLRKPICIFGGDFHLRSDQPLSRIDNYREAQRGKLKQVRGITNGLGVPFINAGDLTHKSRVGDEFLAWIMKKLPQPFYTIWGNHCLPFHNSEQYPTSALNALEKSDDVIVLRERLLFPEDSLAIHPFNFPELPENPKRKKTPWKRVALCHFLTYSGKDKPYPTFKGEDAKSWLKRLDHFDLIVVGDNHQTFLYEEPETGRKILSPGSLLRDDAAQMEHKPCVWIYYNNGDLEPYFLKVAPASEVLTREHIEKVNEKDERLQAFVEHLQKDSDFKELDFKKNLQEFMEDNKTKTNIQSRVWEAIGGQG